MPADLSEFDDSERDAERDRTIRRLQSALARERDRTEMLRETIATAARDAAVLVGKPAKVPTPPRAKPGPGHPEVALVHLTDWQYGKRTDDYDPTICAERIAAAVAGVDKITGRVRLTRPVSKVVVMLGGDMVEGITVYPGQAYEVGLNLFEQVFGCARVIAESLRSLAARFDEVEVYPVAGNHGRIGRRGDVPRTDNTDRMAYEAARTMTVDEPRIAWHPHDSWHQQVRIGAYGALLVHGDQIKMFGGNVPAYGIHRRATAWRASGISPGDVYVGHFHTHGESELPDGSTVYTTGSPESGNEYAREFMGAASRRASQRLHFIDPERGRVTASYRLWLA